MAASPLAKLNIKASDKFESFREVAGVAFDSDSGLTTRARETQNDEWKKNLLCAFESSMKLQK